MDAITLEIFSDHVWPFCWLAQPAVHELVRAEPRVQVVWRTARQRTQINGDGPSGGSPPTAFRPPARPRASRAT